MKCIIDDRFNNFQCTKFRYFNLVQEKDIILIHESKIRFLLIFLNYIHYNRKKKDTIM